MTMGSSSDTHELTKAQTSLDPPASRRVHDTPELLQRIVSILTTQPNDEVFDIAQITPEFLERMISFPWTNRSNRKVYSKLALSSKHCWEQVARMRYKEISWKDYEYLTTTHHFGSSKRLNYVRGMHTIETDYRVKKLLSIFTPSNLLAVKTSLPNLRHIKSSEDTKKGNQVSVEFLLDGTRRVKWSYTAVVSTSGAVKGYKMRPPGSSDWQDWSVELSTNLLFKVLLRGRLEMAQVKHFLKWYEAHGCPALSRIDMGHAGIDLARLADIIEEMNTARSTLGLPSSSSPLTVIRAKAARFTIQEFEDFAIKIGSSAPNTQSIEFAYDWGRRAINLSDRLSFSRLPQILDLIDKHLPQVHDFHFPPLCCDSGEVLQELYRQPVPFARGRRLSSITISLMFWASASMLQIYDEEICELDGGSVRVSGTKLLFAVARWLLSYCEPGASVVSPGSKKLRMLIQYLQGLPLAAQNYIRATDFWSIKLDSLTDIEAHFGNSQLWSACNDAKSASIDSSGSMGICREEHRS